MIGIKTKIILALSALSLAAFAGWRIDSLKSDRESLTGKLARSEANLSASEQSRWKEHASALRIYNREQTRIQELEDEKNRLARLAADDSIGLRISADCPGLPEDSASAGGSDAAAPRLSDSARRDYFTLRSRIAEAVSQIEGLQKYVREECLAQKKPDK